MKAGHPNCTNHSQDVFENGVINAGRWKEHHGSMIVSQKLLNCIGCASMLVCDKDTCMCLCFTLSLVEPEIDCSQHAVTAQSTKVQIKPT
jgi:hypothetical protein